MKNKNKNKLRKLITCRESPIVNISSNYLHVNLITIVPTKVRLPTQVEKTELGSTQVENQLKV